MLRSSWVKLICLLLGCFCSVCVNAAGVDVWVPGKTLIEFQKLVDPEIIGEIEDFTFLQGKPEVAELVLLIKALQVGGFSESIFIKSLASGQDILTVLASGEVALAGMSFWRSEVQSNREAFWLSDALIRQGEYSLGVYTCGKPPGAQELINGLPRYTGVFVGNEAVSLKTLQSVGVKRLQIMEGHDAVVDVLCHGGADFTFAPFPATENLVINTGASRLQPVQGLKVGVEGSRHFLVSKAHARGRSLYFMLQRGLRKMRVKGTITQLYQQSGVINAHVEHWQLLNP